MRRRPIQAAQSASQVSLDLPASAHLTSAPNFHPKQPQKSHHPLPTNQCLQTSALLHNQHPSRRSMDNSAILNCFGSGENLQFRPKSGSATDIHGQQRPATLAPPVNLVSTSMKNISKSNRSLLENMRKEIREGKGHASQELSGTVCQNIRKVPGNGTPVYVFGDRDADDVECRPGILQRSKSFVIDRAASIRKSFKGKIRVAATVQDPKSISFVFSSVDPHLPLPSKSESFQTKQSISNVNKDNIVKSKSKPSRLWFRRRRQSEK